MSKRSTILLWTQVFVPDAASVGQHMADVATELARRGHRVLVLTSNRGYDDPGVRYPRRERQGEVEVLRLPFSSFGKKSLFVRTLGAFSFMLQAFAVSLVLPRLRGVLFSTSPPLVGVGATLLARIRRVPTVYWAMDINPDQLTALGHASLDSRAVRLLDAWHRSVLRRAGLIVTLDRFMAARLEAKVPAPLPLAVIPPWPHEDHLDPVAHADNPFRHEHGLDGKLVVMYSGNHSPCNPLDTLLAAAVHFRNHPRLRFVFIGGGEGKGAVEQCARENGLTNVLSLPYQPLDQLRYSLSAADVHVVSLGDEMVGIIHPCKVYGALAVGRPILYLGPDPSHVTDLLAAHRGGWEVRHGDGEGMIRALEQIVDTPPAQLAVLGAGSGRRVLRAFGQRRLCGRFCDRVERVVGPAVAPDGLPATRAVPRMEEATR